jgi:hypothetical protein
MKLNRMMTLCAMALALSAGSLLAQDNGGGGNGDNNGGGGFRRGGGNFDPAQFQQRMMDRVRDELNFTNDTDWDAVQPLVQKVMDAQRDVRADQFRGMMGGRNRGGQGGGQGGQIGNRGPGGMFGAPSPERDALQKAVDADAPAAQVKDLLAKYEASKKVKQAKLLQAQTDLRAVLSSKQEAQATLLGLLD